MPSMLKYLCLVLTLLVVTVSIIPIEDAVLVLNDSNFDEAIHSNPFVLVEFYAPWCGHCKKLAPEWAAAANRIKANQNIHANLAKVDATESVGLANRFNIKSFPTILYFQGNTNEVNSSVYDGGRTALEITAWIRKKMSSRVSMLYSMEELNQLQEENDAVVLGLFADTSSKAAISFNEYAFNSKLDEHITSVFVVSSSGEISTILNSSMNSVVVLKTFDENCRDYVIDNQDSAIDDEALNACIGVGGDVLALDDSTFDDAIVLHRRLLVNFYAPWCGYCKKLAPKWEAAATRLRDYTAVRLAKVDATLSKDLAKRMEISVYPTLKYFSHGDDSTISINGIDYSGGQTAREIASWARKKAGPKVVVVETLAELNNLRDENEIVVLGVFSALNIDVALSFMGYVSDSKLDLTLDFRYAITSSKDIRESLNISRSTVVVLKNFDDLRSDFLIRGNEAAVYILQIDEFIITATTPDVQIYSDETARRGQTALHIFGSPIKDIAFFIKGKGTNVTQLNHFIEPLSRQFRGKIMFVIVTGNPMGLATHLGVSYPVADLAKLITVRMATTGMEMYPSEGALTSEGIVSHVQAHLNGKL